MPLTDAAYAYWKNFFPNYERVIKFSYSKYPFSFDSCPILAFKRSSGSITIFNQNTPYPIWKAMFKHKLYGLAFFAYHTAIIECYPRIIWHTFCPLFSLIEDNLFYELSLLYESRSTAREILIRACWFDSMANDIAKLKIYSEKISRVTAWRLFIASLKLYNDVVTYQRNEHDRLFLMPPPGASWRIGMGHDRWPGRTFAELSVSDYQGGEPLNMVKCRPPITWSESAPEDWTLENFFPAR